ncbi:TonB-dependent receptor domain-containing protein [Portibacter lacus]|uniref:TonB-dependent receptor n=1 Tax=Portibacter lacus TaxID=1099794 RepID=A0AA37SN26_9BACT|nr:TonB-dependent receptor [Portibacter lacus]GLR17581.1 TonB-dependent receptor [Portibacter lacus]
MSLRSLLKTLFLFILVFQTIYCGAQISGVIIDEKAIPLEYGTATLYMTSDSSLVTGVITDASGTFVISDLKNENYYLEVSFIGYNSVRISDILITKQNSSVDLGEIGLSLGTKLDEVVIQADRAAVVNKIDRQVYETKNFQNSQGGSATDVLKNLPSVTIDGQGEINVRGSSGFVVLLNGKPIQGSAEALMSQFPANAIERIELITAPSAKYDPEGKAGIINIITKKGIAEGAFAQVNVKGGLPSIETYGNEKVHQRYGIDGTYNLRKEKYNISLGGSYQRNDKGGRREGDVYTIINDTLTQFPSSGERSFDEVNYSGRFTLDLTPDPKNSYSLGLYAGKRSKDRLADITYYDNHKVTPAVNGERISTFQYYNHNLRKRKGDFALGSFDYNHAFDNQSNLSASVLYEYTLLGGPTVNQNLGEPNHDILYQDEYNTNDNPLNGLRFSVDYRLQPFSFGRIETGYQYRSLLHKGDFVYQRRTDYNDDFELIPAFSSEVDLERIIHSGYVQLTGGKDNIEYAAGIRAEAVARTFDLRDKANTIDTTYLNDYLKFFPSASIQYTFENNTKLKLSYSKRVERTTTFKMNPFPEREHSETLEQGDPTLQPEFIDLVELGVSRSFDGGNSIFATAYFRDVKNVVNRVNTIYNDTILNRIYSNVGDARSFGLEVGAQIKPTKQWSNFIGFNVYNYSIQGAYDNEVIDQVSTIYSINANASYDFWKTASAQFTFNYLSARNTAQGEDSRFYSPNLSLRKTFLNNRLTALLQWQNIDMGLLSTNEQRITTSRAGSFYTTTNYIYEVDMIVLNLSYTFKNGKNKSRFIDSEFGKREF